VSGITDPHPRSGWNGGMRALAAVAAAALAACAHAPPPPAPIPVVPPLVAIETAGFEGLGFTGLDLAFRARVENPNPTPLSAVRVEYALELEGRRAAVGALDAAIAVPAADAAGPGGAAVDLPVRVRYAAVPGVAAVLALDREARYALRGAVVFLTRAGEVRVPIAADGIAVVPHLPKIRVAKLSLRSASPREIVLDLALEVDNPNDFDVPAGRIGCGLHLQGKEIVRADVLFPDAIAPGGTARAVLPITLSPLRTGGAVAKLLIPFKSIDVRLEGEAEFGGVPLPLDISASILSGE
jgi:LEA14-like dessication related protein